MPPSVTPGISGSPQHPISLCEIIERSVKAAASDWLASNSDEILERVAQQIANHVVFEFTAPNSRMPASSVPKVLASSSPKKGLACAKEISSERTRKSCLLIKRPGPAISCTTSAPENALRSLKRSCSWLRGDHARGGRDQRFSPPPVTDASFATSAWAAPPSLNVAIPGGATGTGRGDFTHQSHSGSGAFRPTSVAVSLTAGTKDWLVEPLTVVFVCGGVRPCLVLSNR